MVDYVGTVVLTATAALLWKTQSIYDYVINPDGSITDNGLTVDGVNIKGNLVLADEATTFLSSRQLAEFYKGQERTWYDNHVEKLWKATFCRLSTGNFYAWIQKPFIFNIVGEARSAVEMFLILIGDTTDFKSYYIVSDLDVLTSDWGI